MAVPWLSIGSRYVCKPCRDVRATGSTPACSRQVRYMDTVDLKLAQDCEALAVAASEGVGWLKAAADQSPMVAQQAPSLISELQKVRNQSRKLARAARRRMCVGVFGPSQ